MNDSFRNRAFVVSSVMNGFSKAVHDLRQQTQTPAVKKLIAHIEEGHELAIQAIKAD